MSVKLYIQPNTLKPTSAFTYTISEGGNATGSHVFNCRYIDYESVVTRAKLQEGVSITELDPNIPSSLWFLKITGYTPEHQKGGITRIRVQLKGFQQQDGQSSGITERNTTYSYRGSLSQESILNHPNYKKVMETNPFADVAISALWFGSAHVVKSENKVEDMKIRSKVSSDLLDHITDPDAYRWAAKVLAGLRYYDKPQLEWSINQSNEGGMEDSDVNDFGQAATPDGDPPKPDWAAESWWMYSGLVEEKDDDSSSFSRTYTLRHEPFDADLYEY